MTVRSAATVGSLHEAALYLFIHQANAGCKTAHKQDYIIALAVFQFAACFTKEKNFVDLMQQRLNKADKM